MTNKASSVIKGLQIILPKIFHDFRGEHVETFSAREYDFADEHGCKIEFVEDDISTSKYGILKGLHGDAETWKLIHCILGEIHVVVVDMRKNSPSYLKWEAFTINEKNRMQLLIPAGCVNGHVCLSENCILSYKQSKYYTGAGNQLSVRWDDPAFNIPWPVKEPILSERDAAASYL